MRPNVTTESDGEQLENNAERELDARPERLNRPNASRRVKMRATRRNRSNDTARRGMHQRRRKRFSW
jgi:hypothetical protein